MFTKTSLITAIAAITLCGTAVADMEMGQALQSSFIWLASAPAGQQAYVVFRKNVDLSAAPKEANLHVFADSRYTLWINRRYVLRGPCRFDPKAPEFDTVNVRDYLVKGPNVITVLVHHCHDGKPKDEPAGFIGRIMRHEPGLTACLEITNEDIFKTRITTDATWRASKETRYRPSTIHWGGICDEIDARIDKGDWLQADFDDSRWEFAVPISGDAWGPLRPRSIPLLKETAITPKVILKQTGEENAGPTPLSGALPLVLAAGAEMLLDVGQTTLAYNLVDLEAEAGSTLEIRHGHGCVNNRLDESYGVDRYIARAGRQAYMGNDSRGFRYMLIKAASGDIKIHSVQVVQRLYPFDRVGQFNCNDSFLNELWQRSVWTVQLCSEDGYEDCNARERTEWMGDAALSEYPITRVALAARDADGSVKYGDPRLIRNMLRHIAQSQQPDGRLKAHHPSNRWDIHGYIEDYSCLWMLTLAAYYEATGDLELVRELWPALTKQMQWFLDHRAESGLVKGREFVFFDNPLSYKECEGATLNAYVIGALTSAAGLAESLDDKELAARYKDAAATMKRRLNEVLWNSDERTFYGSLMDGSKTPPTAFAAMVALYFDIVPETERAAVLDWLVRHKNEVGTPYTHHFLLAALYDADRPDLDKLALDIMRDRWTPTLARKDLDTVFEGFNGGALCHNMGATAAYFLSGRVLGVRRDGSVANRRIRIEPHLGDLTTAEGVVVTEFGPVPVSWKQNAGDQSVEFRIEVPADVQADVAFPCDSGSTKITVDGNQTGTSQIDRTRNRSRIVLGSGPHAGQVSK